MSLETQLEDIEDYIIMHIGEGEFKVKTEGGEIKDAGPNLCGMIRYTYFEDFTLPDLGWQVTRRQLLLDYTPKVMKDLADGKIKPQQNEQNTD
jgi:hypothetical protein